MDDLLRRLLSDPVAAREAAASTSSATTHIERTRWPDGPLCPHCGSSAVKRIARSTKSRSRRLFKCVACGRQFNYRKGTPLERRRTEPRAVCLAAALLAEGVAPEDVRGPLEDLGCSEAMADSVLTLFAAEPGGGEFDPRFAPGEPPLPGKSRRGGRWGWVTAACLAVIVLVGAAIRALEAPEVLKAAWKHEGETMRLVTPRDPGESFEAWVVRHEDDVERLKRIYTSDSRSR